MSSATEEVKFSLKVMISKDETKVLFAQANSDFADVLLSFLTLPLGTMVRLLNKHYGDEAPLFGSLNALYKSLADLDIAHFWTETGKQMLLKPTSSFEAKCHKLKLNIDDTEPTKYYTCPDMYCGGAYGDINMYDSTARCKSCGKMKNKQLSEFPEGADGVFTMKAASFLLSDDLRMVPMINGSFIQTLNNLGITNATGAKQKTVCVGFNEIMDLLKGSLLSPTPLTDIILHNRQTDPASIAVKLEPAICFNQIKQEETCSNSEKRKMILKVMVQISANRLLFAHAEEDFVDFLFSFLTIPLGGVECLLGSNTCLKNIDNLYRSIANMYENGENLNRYLKSTQVIGNSLVKPHLPPKYLSKNQLFSLTEENSTLYHLESPNGQVEYLSSNMNSAYNYYKVSISDPKGPGSYVMGPRVYMVTDDLTVTPLRMSSTLSMLDSLNIPLSDVKEVTINIGVEEGLSILKASLTSTCALSNGLSHILKK